MKLKTGRYKRGIGGSRNPHVETRIRISPSNTTRCLRHCGVRQNTRTGKRVLLKAVRKNVDGESTFEQREPISFVTFNVEDRVLQTGEGLTGVRIGTLTTTEDLQRTSHLIDTLTNAVYSVRFVSGSIAGFLKYTLEEVENDLDERIFASG
ncbi:MAG: hypothetical protein IIB46_01635 [Nitrospinae bacterium]|nr:hypothetical protein [Nitrospinota bacterium]